MNIRSHLIELQCNSKDVHDVSQAIIHSLIFFRTYGKFNYKHESNYSIGTLGYEKVNCDQINFSYIRCNCPGIVKRIDTKINELLERVNESTQTVTFNLEFYTKVPRWPFNDTKIVWELWNIRLLLNQSPSNGERHNNPEGDGFFIQNAPFQRLSSQHSQRSFRRGSSGIEDLLSQKLLDIIRLVNSDKCSTPQMPVQSNLDNIFDTGDSELQPYLFNLTYKLSEHAPGLHQTGSRQSARYSEANTLTDSSTQSMFKKFLLGTLEL